NAVQRVQVDGGPTGGTFTLTFGGQTTAAIPYNATASQVQTALAALSSVGSGNVACSGGPLPGTDVLAAFQGALATGPLATMTADGSGLTGGTTPGVVTGTDTAGVAPDTTLGLSPNIGLVWDYQGVAPQPFLADVSTVRVTNPGAADANVRFRLLSKA